MSSKNLRRLNSDDKKRIAELANNKNIWDNLRDFIPFPYELQDAEFFINLTLQESPEQTFGIINDKDELCGVISLIVQNDVYRKSAELGYWIGEQYWGKGLATKAIEDISKYGFEQLCLERLYAGVYEFNIASMKALENNGYRKEGIFRKSVFKNSTFFDEHRFSKLNGE